VANINFTTSEMTLGQHFESYGDIVHVKIIEDYLGNSKGFGFVEFETKGIHLILE
jgi:U1 small nuclear ribonucleoprotein